MRTALTIWAMIFLAVSVSAELADGPVHQMLWNRVDQVVVADSAVLCLSDRAISVGIWDDTLRQFVVQDLIALPYGGVRMRRFDSLVVIQSDDNRLVAYDWRELASLEPVWEIDPGGAFADFAVAGGHVYVTKWFAGMWRYALDGAGGGVLADTSQVGVMLTQVTPDGEYVYVLDEYNGIMRYDPMGGGSAGFVDYLNVPVEVTAFTVAEQGLTMQSQGGGLVLGDVSGGTPVLGAAVAAGMRSRKIFAAGSDVIAVLARSIELRDRATGALKVSMAVSGLGTEGDLFVTDSGKYLVLPQTGGGLYLFDLETPTHSRPGLYRSGPIQSLAFVGDRLVTGGGGNPLDVFTFDSVLTPTRAYTMYPELSGVQTAEAIGDTVIAYYAGINRVAFILDVLEPDSFFLERSFHLSDTLAGRLQFLPRFGADTLRGVVTTGEFSLQAYAISDSGLITEVAPWEQTARIVSTLVRDSLVIVGTTKRQLWVQRIDSTLDLQTVANVDLSGLPTALEWVDGKLAVFQENRVSLYELDSAGMPTPAEQADLPLTVLDVTTANGRVYAVGSTGIAEITVDSSGVQVIDFGGNPGRLIAAAPPVLAVSDGGSIDIYRIAVPPVDTGGEEPPLPSTFAVYQNYPNPFNGETVIRYDLPRAGRVKLTVFNMLGQEVNRLVDGERPAGEHEAVWDGTNGAGMGVASGVYLYRIEAEGYTVSKKMVLVK